MLSRSRPILLQLPFLLLPSLPLLAAPTSQAPAPKPRVSAAPDSFALGQRPAIELSAVDALGQPYAPSQYQFEWRVEGAELVDGSSWTDPEPLVRPLSDRPFEAELILWPLGPGQPGKGAIGIGLNLGQAILHGEPVKWHPLELWFQGPVRSMYDDAPNPFLDGRLDVRFTRPDGSEVAVPGFFAGNGRGGGTGPVWKVRLSPDQAGTWSFAASVRQGVDVAVAADPFAGSPAQGNGASGQFEVAPRDPEAPGFLRYGRLEYVGGHYRRFADGPFWIKSGTDSPENLLGFAGFAEVEKASGSKGVLHRYAPHAGDWTLDDPELPLAGSGGGDASVSRNLFGALNYLESVGVNAIYFLPMNLGGDGQDTAPFVGYAKTAYDKTHYHIGRLYQWEAVFRHAQELGIQLQFVLSETEFANETWLDEGLLGVERKLFYRELVARFSHHLALKWNLAEENDFTISLLEDKANWLAALDPWKHGIAAHNKPSDLFSLNAALLGKQQFQHTSIQYEPSQAGLIVEQWRADSAAAGQPWILDLDENNPADLGAQPDNADELRKQVVYDVYFSGGQLEWYLGGQPLPIGGDLDLEDFRTREAHWLQTRAARELLEELPFPRMEPMDGLVFGETNVEGGAEVFAEPGRAFAIYLPSASADFQQLDLSAHPGLFTQRWFDPRTGTWAAEAFEIEGGGWHLLDEPPYEIDEDWVAVVRRRDLWAGSDSIQLSTGGQFPCFLEAPIELAGQPWIAVGSLAGTIGDYPKDGSLFPLVPDAYLDVTLQAPGNSAFQPVNGLFDSEGRAVASVALPPISSPSLVGQTLTFVWLAGVFEPIPGYPQAPSFPVYASDPFEVRLTP